MREQWSLWRQPPSRWNYVNLCSRTYTRRAHTYLPRPALPRKSGDFGSRHSHGSSFAPLYVPFSGRGYHLVEIHFVKAWVVSTKREEREKRHFYNLICYGVPCTINYRDKQTPANYTFTRPLHGLLSGILLWTHAVVYNAREAGYIERLYASPGPLFRSSFLSRFPP